MRLSLPDSPWFYRALNTPLLLLLLWFFAALFWHVLTPRPSLPLPAPTRTEVQIAPQGNDLSALRPLFSGEEGNKIAISSLNLQLRGVAAPYTASFERPGQPWLTVAIGEVIDGGVTLSAVFPDRVLLNNQGKEERIDFKPREEARSDSLPLVSTTPAIPDISGLISAAQPRRDLHTPQLRKETGTLPMPSAKIPDGRPAPVPRSAMPGTLGAGNEKPLAAGVGVSAIAAPGAAENIPRNVLLAALQSSNINAWGKGLGNAPNGGIQILDDQAQAVFRALRLRNGDVLRALNDRPISGLADLPILYNAFSSQVRLTLDITRNGNTMQLRYSVV